MCRLSEDVMILVDCFPQTVQKIGGHSFWDMLMVPFSADLGRAGSFI
jgi:hypothetical protein